MGRSEGLGNVPGHGKVPSTLPSSIEARRGSVARMSPRLGCAEGAGQRSLCADDAGVTCLHIQLGVLALRHDLAGGRFAAERPTARGGYAKRPSARSVGLINI